jgi:hypothetical protein
VGVEVGAVEVAVGKGTLEGAGETIGWRQAVRRAADRMNVAAAKMARFIGSLLGILNGNEFDVSC